MASNDTDYASRQDLASAISKTPMSGFQAAAVALCLVINALDGFDVMVVAFTASAISREWGLVATQVGALFSAGLAGMALGAIFVAPLGDRYGRRPLILACQILIGATMLLSALSQTVWQLSATRVLTGIGIGGLLASINIMVAEYSSDRRRALCIALMSLGYPIGAALGGLVSIYLLEAFGWRSVYLFGALAMLAVVPFTLAMLPESLSFLLLRPDHRTLGRINALLHKMNKPALTALPSMPAGQLQKPGLLNLARGAYAWTTLLMGLVYLGTMFSVYFLLNWIPKILTGLGFSDTGGISASLVMNVTGAVACLLMGLYANRFGLWRLASLIFAGLFASMAWFGLAPASDTALLSSVAVLGFFLFSTIAVSYVIVPAVFPAEIRLTAMGACLAFGRLGGVLGPYVAGVLITLEWSRAAYCIALGVPVLVALLALHLVRPGQDANAAGRRAPAGQAGGAHLPEAR